MRLSVIIIASAALVCAGLITQAEAKSRAISTDSSVTQTELDTPPANSVAHLVFISAAGTGQTYTGGGTRDDYISLTSSSPIPGTPIFCSGKFDPCTGASTPGDAVILASSPLNLVLTTQDNTGAAVTYPLDSFFVDNSLSTANPITDPSGFNVGKPEESGQIYIDQVQSVENFGVPAPANLAALLAAPGVSDVQYLGWQDNDPPASAFANANDDPWTYNNFVVAVYYTPIGSTIGGVPEPASWTMMLVGLFGLGAVVRRTRQVRPLLSTTAA